MYIGNLLTTAFVVSSTAMAFDNHTESHNIDTFSTSHVNRPSHSIKSSQKYPRGLLDRIRNFLSGSRGVSTQEEKCPAVWYDISATLTEQFLADGECTDAARAAIRASFHDCFNGACDGSLILANECSNNENKGLERLCGNLANVASQTGVGVADLIQFAAAHAIKTCPGGPTVPVVVGREDSYEANELGVLPSGRAAGGDLIRLFASKGFTPTDLSALLGAHTTARQRASFPSSPSALDSTPGQWDTTFYSQTLSDSAPFTLPADKNVAQNPLTAVSFARFARSKDAWDRAFVSAMEKMSFMGVEGEGFVDCTAALPGGSEIREVRGRDVWGRVRG